MVKLKITNSKIVQQNNTNPRNGLEPYASKQIDHQDHQRQIQQLQENKNSRPTILQDKKIETVNCEDHQKYSEIYTQLQKPPKLPQTLKNTLRRRAKESGHFREKKEIQKVSPIALSIFSKLKKQEIACEICLSTMNSEDIVHLCKCEHVYCKNCTRDYVTYKIQMFEEVICPNEQCSKVMNEQKEFYQNLSEQIKKKYVKIHNFYITSNDPSLKLCPKADCEGIIKLKKNQKVFCEACKRQFCPKCYLETHKGACEQQEIDFLQNNLHFRQCKNCKFIIEKTQGCNHMTCRCKYQFCYVCGKKWRSNHKCNKQNDGLFSKNGYCNCINCCQQVCGRTLALIFQFPIRLILSLIIIITFLLAVTVISAIFIPIGLLGGSLFFSILFLYNLCEQKKYGLAFLCTILFPIPLCIGLYKSVTDLIIEYFSKIFMYYWNLNCDRLYAIWQQ